MGLAERHAYRCVYLRSEKWQTVRLEALVREHGKCELCTEESALNDAHHIWYPENIYESAATHLAILCRPCHEFVHAMLPECKTGNEEFGRGQWLKFKNAVIAWRVAKLLLLSGRNGLSYRTMKMLVIINKKFCRESKIARDDGYTKSFLIHIADEILVKKWDAYRCNCTFKLPSRVTWLLNDIPKEQLHKPNRPVQALWGRKFKFRQLPELNSDPDVYMVSAKVLKGIEFHQHDWDLSMMARSHAITSFLTSLEDNWPCFISYS